jgi:hypothetical protein
MPSRASSWIPPVGTGAASVVLGIIGLMLSWMPVLGITVAGLSLVLGLIAVLTALRPGGALLRWALLGTVLSGFALGVNFAMHYSIVGYIGERHMPTMWQESPDRPWVPPPAPATPIPGG